MKSLREMKRKFATRRKTCKFATNRTKSNTSGILLSNSQVPVGVANSLRRQNRQLAKSLNEKMCEIAELSEFISQLRQERLEERINVDNLVEMKLVEYLEPVRYVITTRPV